MSNLFKSPSGTPQWISPTGTDSTRNNLQNVLNERAVNGPVTQGPTPLQNSGAQMLQGLMGSNFGSAYTTGQNTLQNAAQTGLPVSLDMLKSLEQQRMQQLPQEMAGVTEQLTSRGMGGDTDLARILGETAGRAQTDITATLAPYYLQAGEAQAGRQMGAAQQLLPYAQLPVTAGLGAVQGGQYMREQIDPVMQLLANLASQGGLGQTQYGPSPGSQLLQAGSSLLPWLGMSSALPSIGKLLGGAASGIGQAGSWLGNLFGSGNGAVNADIFNQGDPWADVFNWGGDVMNNASSALSEADILSLLGEGW